MKKKKLIWVDVLKDSIHEACKDKPLTEREAKERIDKIVMVAASGFNIIDEPLNRNELNEEIKSLQKKSKSKSI